MSVRIIDNNFEMWDRCTVPENINYIESNRIFVFGSNLAGRHGAGAARIAMKNFGAIYGLGYGLSGQSFAIPTKDHNIQTLPLTEIEKYIKKFCLEAANHPDKIFLVTQIGCGLAGYKPYQIAPLFKGIMPENVRLPAAWGDLFDRDEIKW